MRKTYTGSCHCQAIRFEVDLDLSKGSVRCNCRICRKTRNWNTRVSPSEFRLLTPDAPLTDYGPGPWSHWTFCPVCGVRPFFSGTLEALGGDFVGVQLGCLDDATPEELLSGPVQFCNGKDNDWWNTPAETRHL